MFAVEDFLDAARTEPDDRLRVLAGLAGQTRDWLVFTGDHRGAELFQAVALACAQVRDERKALARRADDAIMESLGVRSGPVIHYPDEDEDG